MIFSRAKAEAATAAKGASYGKVPSYLKQRKLEMQLDAEEAERAAIAAQAKMCWHGVVLA